MNEQVLDELQVDWDHDRLRAVLPILRERLLGWSGLALLSLMLFSPSGALAVTLCYFLGLWSLSDRRLVWVELDGHQLVVGRSVLARSRIERLPLAALRVSTGRQGDRIVLESAGTRIDLRWGGTPASLAWFVDELRHARSGARPHLEEQPVRPPELERVRLRTG